jgi:hypothetical protein
LFTLILFSGVQYIRRLILQFLYTVFWLSLASNTLFRILFLNTISYVSFHVLMAASIKMEALRTPETSVYFNDATRRYIPEGCQLYSFLTTFCTSIATRKFIDVSVLTFTVRRK